MGIYGDQGCDLLSGILHVLDIEVCGAVCSYTGMMTSEFHVPLTVFHSSVGNLALYKTMII